MKSEVEVLKFNTINDGNSNVTHLVLGVNETQLRKIFHALSLIELNY